MDDLPEYLALSESDLEQRCAGRLVILPGREALYAHFAGDIAGQIQANNAAGRQTGLILPVGPVGQYPVLADLCNRDRISWKNVHTFNMDEYCDWQGRPVPASHPLSFAGFMRRNLFDLLHPDLSIPDGSIHFPDPRNLDRISAEIEAAGGVDACYGGIGIHGHVAFNEPPISRWYKLTPEQYRASLTRLLPLAPETVVLNSIRGAGGNLAALPPMAVTLGMADLLRARRIRLYCDGGAWQRTVLRIALLAPEDVDYPVTLLRIHPDLLIIADRETAASPLPEIDG